MPYARKSKQYKRKNDLYKKRSYQSRFNDKKINTAIEKKIKAIAVREDKKRERYYTHATYLLNTPTTTWTSLHARPQITDQVSVPNGTSFRYTYLTNISEEVKNGNINNISTNVDARTSIDLRVKTVQAQLRFTNLSNVSRQVRVSLIYVPNLNQATLAGGAPVQPKIQMLGDVSGKFKGIFRNMLKNTAGTPPDNASTQPGTQFQILATKTFKVDGTGPGTTYQDRLGYKDCFISKTWKNGKKFIYNHTSTSQSQSLMSSGNIFVGVVCDADATVSSTFLYYYGVGGIKFRLASPPKDITDNLT